VTWGTKEVRLAALTGIVPLHRRVETTDPAAVYHHVVSVLHLVRAQIADAVVAHAEASIHAELIRLLARPGYALHPQSRCRAGVFALEVHRAARRSFDETALLVATAVELQRQSGSLFDELSGRPAGGLDAADLALAVALLVAATAAAADASGRAADPAATLRHFCDATGGACAGQILDVRRQRSGATTLEDSLRLRRLRSGTLGRFAAGFAVRAAGVEPADASLFERLGFHLFTFAHLMHDHPDAGRPDPLVALPSGHAPPAGGAPAPQILSPEYDSRGGSSFSEILALAYLGRAHADLQLLAARGYAVEALGRFLQHVESEGRPIAGALGPMP
jgi:hypothetical protein